MKNLSFSKTLAFVLILSIGFVSTGCFGEFQLTRKLYSWNDSVTDNKFVKTLLFYGMAIIPVYAAGGFLDVVVFNLIEFWGGSNPLAMNEGEVEERHFAYNGEEYNMIVTKNQFTVIPLTGEKAGELQVLRFDPEIHTWHYEDAQNCIAVLGFEGDNFDVLKINSPDGNTALFQLNSDASVENIADMYTPLSNSFTFASKD